MSKATSRFRNRLAAAVGTTLSVTTLALAGGVAQPAQAVPGVSAAVFDPDEVGWYSYRDQTSSAFSSTFEAKAKSGYIITDIDIETAGGYRVGSVWQQNLDGRAWKEKRNLTSSQFSDEWHAAKRAGMRLVEQETYVAGGRRLWAGIWVQNKEGAWASHRGQTNSQFKASFGAHLRAGLMPVDYDEYLTPYGIRYNSVWVKRPAGVAWRLYRGLSSRGFSSKFHALKSSYRALAFDSLATPSGQRYAGIWISNDNGRGWALRRNMTKTSYLNHWYRYRDLGYRVVSFDRYETAAGTRYAAIWRQNTSRPDWELKNDVDNRVQDELAKGAPGISVAVFNDGKPAYLRGFGHADIDDGIWMDSSHVGSTASVSKAVAGVLALRMQEQGLLDIDDATRDHVPAMPEHHSHTISDLVANRGCVRHYGEGPSGGYGGQSFDTALDAAEMFWDDPLVCTPGEYHYSTHGYTLLGAALEAAGNDDVKDLVSKKLTIPFGLGTVGPQDNSPSVHRMSIYSGDDNEISTPNNDWKVLGGGIDASAADLAKFGSKLIGGQILTQDSLDEMWTPPNGESGYAHGWSTGTEDGTQVVAKNGSWTGNLAYLRLYPEKGISVAVLINSRAGDWSAVQLGRDIGAMVLATE